MSSCCVENNLVETPTTPTSPTTNDVFIDDDGFSTKEPVLGHSKIKDSIKYNKEKMKHVNKKKTSSNGCLLYTSPSPRDKRQSRMPSSA